MSIGWYYALEGSFITCVMKELVGELSVAKHNKINSQRADLTVYRA